MGYVAAAMFVGQTAMSFLQKEDAYQSQRRAAKKAFKQQERQRFAAYQQEREQVERSNAYSLMIWNQQKKQTQQQLEWNTEAFNIANRDAQLRFNDVLAEAMFAGTDLTRAELQAAGRTAASGSTSRSAFRREALEVGGMAGNQRRMLMRNLVGEEAGLERAFQSIARNYEIANEQARAQSAIPPLLETIGPYRPGTFQGLERPNQFISGFNSVTDGFRAAAPFIPPSTTAFGKQGFGRKLLTIARGVGGQDISKSFGN